MELSIKNIGDITYLSELIPPFWQGREKSNLPKRAGLIRPDNLCSLTFHKLWSH